MAKRYEYICVDRKMFLPKTESGPIQLNRADHVSLSAPYNCLGLRPTNREAWAEYNKFYDAKEAKLGSKIARRQKPEKEVAFNMLPGRAKKGRDFRALDQSIAIGQPVGPESKAQPAAPLTADQVIDGEEII